MHKRSADVCPALLELPGTTLGVHVIQFPRKLYSNVELLTLFLCWSGP